MNPKDELQRDTGLARAPAASAPLRDGFGATCSHDIHTSMNGILGMLELLLDTDLSDKQRELASIAHVSAEELLRRLNDMLDFSGVNEGTLGLELSAFDLRQEAEAALDGWRGIVQSKDLALTAELPPAGIRPLLGNPARLLDVIAGLLEAVSGAVEGEGEVELRIHATQQVDACDVLISIGTKRYAPSKDKALDRTLMNCRHVLKLMGSQLAEHAEGEQGHAYRFILRLAYSPMSAARQASAGGRKQALRILYADADAAQRETLALQLARAGAEAVAAGSATEVLNALECANDEGKPFHIVMLDRQLPGVDGETLGAALKSDLAYAALHLILLGVRSEEHDECETRAGFSAWLAKPLEEQAVHEVLNKIGQALPSDTDNGAAETALLHESERPFAGYRILVADDVPANRQVALHLLGKLGCQADVAEDGKQAVAMHKQHPYDLILMDCQMPEVDGYQASRAIRAAEMDKEAGKNARTPIVAVTAYTMQGERERCTAAGMDDFLGKPLRLITLREMLARWLEPMAKGAAEENSKDELNAMRDMFGSAFGELAGLYLSDSPKRIVGLKAAIAAHDAAQAAKFAHSLSGSCASIGASALAAICREVEMRCKAGEIEHLENKLKSLTGEYARIESRLKSMVVQQAS